MTLQFMQSILLPAIKAKVMESNPVDVEFDSSGRSTPKLRIYCSRPIPFSMSLG